jgi:hypothetical protein
MRYAFLAALFCVLATIASSAHAECYGDAAAMYGCAPAQGAQVAPRAGAGNLERFGASEAPVLPDTRYRDPQGGTTSDVITPEERRRMLRGIVLGNRRTYSQGSHIQAVNASGRPVRRSGTVTQAGQGR